MSKSCDLCRFERFVDPECCSGGTTDALVLTAPWTSFEAAKYAECPLKVIIDYFGIGRESG